jgi:hypothetical protein
MNIKNGNVRFGRFDAVRDLKLGEVSHLLVIANDRETKQLHCYIELFNIICCVVTLSENYSGPEVSHIYHQDAISYERFNTSLELSAEKFKAFRYSYSHGEFSILINDFFERFEERRFADLTSAVIEETKKEVAKETEEGKLQSTLVDNEVLRRSMYHLMKASIYHFPYLIDDFNDEENEAIQFIHSHMTLERFEKFREINSHLIEAELRFSNGDVYVIDSFYTSLYRKRKGRKIYAVYIVIRDGLTMEKSYIPYRNFIEAINANKQNG